MGKVDDYSAGRADGLRMARDIVARDGLEELEKEIRFRNITGINVGLTRKELDKATEKIKMRTLDTVLVMSVMALRDTFGYGKKRIRRFIANVNRKADCIMSEMVTWDDYIQTIQKELGIEMKIREND